MLMIINILAVLSMLVLPVEVLFAQGKTKKPAIETIEIKGDLPQAQKDVGHNFGIIGRFAVENWTCGQNLTSVALKEITRVNGVTKRYQDAGKALAAAAIDKMNKGGAARLTEREIQKIEKGFLNIKTGGNMYITLKNTIVRKFFPDKERREYGSRDLEKESVEFWPSGSRVEVYALRNCYRTDDVEVLNKIMENAEKSLAREQEMYLKISQAILRGESWHQFFREK